MNKMLRLYYQNIKYQCNLSISFPDNQSLVHWTFFSHGSTRIYTDKIQLVDIYHFPYISSVLIRVNPCLSVPIRGRKSVVETPIHRVYLFTMRH